MNRIKSWVMLAPAVALLACKPAQPPQEQSQPSSAAANSTATTTETITDDRAADPPLLTPEAARGAKGARNVLLAFARNMELRDYGEAWGMLSPTDQRRWSKAAFENMFADLRDAKVAVPDGTIEGAAGSSYYSAPISITGSDKDGREVRYDGKAVLRRVNDVDGASPAQLRWHFETLTLDWTH